VSKKYLSIQNNKCIVYDAYGKIVIITTNKTIAIKFAKIGIKND